VGATRETDTPPPPPLNLETNYAKLTTPVTVWCRAIASAIEDPEAAECAGALRDKPASDGEPGCLFTKCELREAHQMRSSPNAKLTKNRIPFPWN
jgi:hypothetical protein